MFSIFRIIVNYLLNKYKSKLPCIIREAYVVKVKVIGIIKNKIKKLVKRGCIEVYCRIWDRKCVEERKKRKKIKKKLRNFKRKHRYKIDMYNKYKGIIKEIIKNIIK